MLTTDLTRPGTLADPRVGGADVVASLPGLENVFLQSLPDIEEQPGLQHAHSLRSVVLQNMKGFRDFGTLEEAPAFEEFALVEGKAQHPDQLLPVLRSTALRARQGDVRQRPQERGIREAPRRARQRRLGSLGTFRVPLMLS